MYIYIDGGYAADSDVHSTWSAAFVLVDCTNTQHICLSAGGIIDFDESSPRFLGECSPPSSFVSEIYAQIMARILLIQYAHKYVLHDNMHITIVYDNESAAASARASRLPSAQFQLGLFANVLNSLIRDIF